MQMLPQSKTIILKDSNTQDVYIPTVPLSLSVYLSLPRYSILVCRLASRVSLPSLKLMIKKQTTTITKYMRHNGFSWTSNFDTCRRSYKKNNNNNTQIREWSLRKTPVPACYAHTLFMYTDCCRAVNLGIQINTYYIVYTKCDLFPSPPPRVISAADEAVRWKMS